MKKLFALIAVTMLLNFTAAKAQSSATTSPAPSEQKAADVSQCHGVTAKCPIPCTGDKAEAGASTTTLSENYANAGAAPPAACAQMKAGCDGSPSKACCKSSGRASAMTKNMKPAKKFTSIETKETAAPKD